MSKGLQIRGEIIEFIEWETGEIWYPCITNSFKTRFEEIKLIAISPRLALDDEILMITILDSKGNFYQFSCFELNTDSIELFERRLSLENIRDVEWRKFSWEDHENYITDKVIFPKELYWEDLFIKPKGINKIVTQLLKFLSVKKSISGKFNPTVAKYLNK